MNHFLNKFDPRELEQIALAAKAVVKQRDEYAAVGNYDVQFVEREARLAEVFLELLNEITPPTDRIVDLDPPTVPQLLRGGAKTYEERNKLYGDNYKQIGRMMLVLFPRGLPAMSVDGWNRFGVWFMVFNKAIRYAVQPGDDFQGHLDSAHDVMVYGAMLEELTHGRP